MTRPPTLLALLGVVLALALAACGGSNGSTPTAPPAADDAAWTAILADLGLRPGDGSVVVTATGGAPSLSVTIAVRPDAPGPVTFSDGLYGAQAFTRTDDGWERIDTAEIRTEIAPILEPGGSATIDLPVAEADGYRVLVPFGGQASWGGAT